MGILINIKDLKFNKWKVLSQAKTRHGKVSYWFCKCECGIIREVRGSHIRSGRSKDCGCGRKIKTQLMGKRKRKPGCVKIAKYKTYIYGAKNRNISWDLNFEQFLNLCSQNCIYCNKPPSNKAFNANKSEYFYYSGIDRKNNKLGYSMGNCSPCCKICNYGKSTLNHEEFLNWINIVYNNMIK